MRDLAIGVLLAAAGLAGLAWQIEGPAEASGATRPILVCPLGSHGLAPAPFPRVASPSAARVPTRP